VIKGVGHIGLVVKDIEQCVSSLCQALNIEAPAIKDIPEKKTKVALVDINGMGLEFIEDYSEEGGFAKLVRERGNSIHHFCLLSDNIQGDIDTLRERGVAMQDLQPRLGLRGKPIAFTKPTILNGIPVELSTP